MYLMVLKVRQGRYIPFFITERKHSVAALIQVGQAALVQDVFTRKADAHTRLVTTYLMEYVEDWSASRAYLNEQSAQSILQSAAWLSILQEPFCEQT